jgi:hypothetical protein
VKDKEIDGITFKMYELRNGLVAPNAGFRRRNIGRRFLPRMSHTNYTSRNN